MSPFGSAALRLAVFGSIMSAGAAHADVTFTDGTFSASNYVIGFSGSTGSATLTKSTCASCGVSGSALELTISDSDGSALGAAVINNLFSYNPATQGTISTIDASVEKNFFVTAPFNTYGDSFRLVIEQNGSYYTAVTSPYSLGADSTRTTSTGYLPFSLSGLKASDFNKFDTSTGLVGTDHPDFAGGAIMFGLGQVLAASPGTAGHQVTVTSDFDDLSIIVRNAAPEPTTWAMFISGFGISGLSVRRKKHALGLA